MIEETVDIPTKDGQMKTFVVSDAEESPLLTFPGRKIYDRDAAERHWERLIALYRKKLG